MNRTGSLLVAGMSGQLARSLALYADECPDLELHFAGRPQLDVKDLQSCQDAVASVRPDLIINAAAFTGVDASENSREEAYAVNALGPGNLARAAHAEGKPIIHISTDYVYDGEKTSAYNESDPVAPVNAYGLSKLGGERAVAQTNPKHIILRTAWLYSPFGTNFVSKILCAAKTSERLTVVGDQIGNPTSALDLARTLLALSRAITERDWERIAGIYHVAGTETLSRHEFAEQILGISKTLSGPACGIGLARTADFPAPARRPLRTALDTHLFKQCFGLTLPGPESSLRKVVEGILRQRTST